MKKPLKKMALKRETVLRMEELKSAQGAWGDGDPMIPDYTATCKCKTK